MADFTSRQPEVDEQVEEFVEWSKEEEANRTFGNPKPVPDNESADWVRSFEQERTNFPAKVADYFSARSRRLNELVDGMATVSSGGKDADAIWRSATDGLASDVSSILSSILSGVGKPSGKASGLLFRIQLEEDSFAKSLGGRGVAGGWTQLTALVTKVQRTLLEMDVAWEELVSEVEEMDEQADARVKTLVAAMKAADDAIKNKYEGAARALTEGGGGLSELAEAAKLVTFDGTSTEKFKDVKARAEKVLNGISAAIKDLDQLQGDVGAGLEPVDHAIKFLNYLQDSEVGIVQRNYKRLHEGAEDLARDPSPDRAARDIADETKSGLSEWSGAMVNPGQRADADKLAELLCAQTDAIALVVEDAWSTLRKENDGRWLGSLNSTHRNQLVGNDAWAARRRDVAAVNLKGNLEKVKEGAGRSFGIDLDSGIRKVIDAVNERPGTEKDRLAFASFLDKQREEIGEQLSSVKTFLGHTAGRWLELIGGPEFERAIKRSAVESGI